jgi:hypothetical protein
MTPEAWIEQQEETTEFADALWALQHAESPLTVLRAIADVREYAISFQDTAVRAAREGGATWEQIAEAMRVSRQAVHRRYAKDDAERESAEPAS